MTTKFGKAFLKLIEAKVIRINDPTSLTGKFTILCNPSIYEYEEFKKNTKYNAIRGIGIKDDIYITDASNGIHANLKYQVLNYLGYDVNNIDFSDYINCSFSEDENDNFSASQFGKNEAFEKLKSKHQTINNNEGYFNLEDEYKEYELQNIDNPELLTFDQWMKKKGK